VGNVKFYNVRVGLYTKKPLSFKVLKEYRIEGQIFNV
jgi:hypothetical protein